jgi:hypothetical protein
MQIAGRRSRWEDVRQPECPVQFRPQDRWVRIEIEPAIRAELLERFLGFPD